jgi:hypothetical protein
VARGGIVDLRDCRVLGVSRNTIRRALGSDAPPRYQRRPAGDSVVDHPKPRIRELLAAYPALPATVISERIGWPYSIRAPSPSSSAPRAALALGHKLVTDLNRLSCRTSSRFRRAIDGQPELRYAELREETASDHDAAE